MRALESIMPDQAFVYLGDHGNAPYGNDASDEIYDLTKASVARLFKYGCSLVVIACNTAVATSLTRLQETWLPETYPDRKVIGVIEPVAEAISEDTGRQMLPDGGVPRHYPDPCVAIFATQHTVRSNVFGNAINHKVSAIQVYQRACPGLALLIEEDAPEEMLRAEIRKHVRALLSDISSTPDFCILGCTHYPIVEHLWRAELPESVNIISQPDVCAKSLVRYLRKNPHLSSVKAGANIFLTTGDVKIVSERASLFYRSKVAFSKVDV